MNGNSEDRITEMVLKSFEGTPSQRLHVLMVRLVTHLHAFIREVEPTEQEWFAAIDFLTRTGQMYDKRQEFILLSDTLGVSMLVDAINHRMGAGATESTIFGPFYRSGAEALPYGASINKDGGGVPAVVSGRVLAIDGRPIPNATLDVWETNENGMYDQQDQAQSEMNLRGKFRTDDRGRYKFVGIKPVPYPIPDDGPVGEMLRASGRDWYRAAHIHLIVSAEGYVPVTTHLFVKGDLESDAVFGVKDSLIADFVRHESAEEAAHHNVSAPFYTVEHDWVLKPLA
jgi:hydroxyquinol 1,2-dioxygenase